ncbi:MAG: DUF4115 domain-containing protein, partial [Rhodobacterales bacterium]|nr:DUF4115 domain-containing protein [Rhodobacterales bacterium]
TVPAPPLVEAPAAAPPAPPTLSSPSLAVRAPVAPPAPADSLIDMSAAPAVGSSGDGILVRATKDSWIQVRDVAADALLVTQLLRAGDSYAVPDRSGLVLLTGNAGALEILVNGESMPPIGGEGDVRRGVALNADRLRAGTAVIE